MSFKSSDSRELWEFGEFRLDGRARLLLRDGIPVPLTPKAFDVLLHLARNAGRAVSREELLDAVWPDTVVTDASLTQAVFLVRKALGDAEVSRIVETVPRVGYRLNLPETATRPEAAPEPAAPGPGGDDGAGRAPADRETPAPSGPGPESRKRRVPPALLGAAAALVLVALGAALVLLRGPAAGGAGGTEPPTAAPDLLSLEREVAVPPDAYRVLGAIDGTVVLAAPSAFYLLPSDGALAASRVPLGAGEVAAAPLGGGRLLVVRSGRVFSRHPARPGEEDLGPLPADAPAAVETRVTVSRSGRFLALRGEETWEIFEAAGSGWVRRLRARVPRVEGEVFDVGENLAALATGDGGPVRAWSLPDGAPLLSSPFPERRIFAVAVDDARGQVAVSGPFDSVAVFPTQGDSRPRALPRRGWTYGLAWVGDAPTLLASGLEGIAAFRAGAEPVATLPPVSPGGSLLLDSDFLLALVPRRQRLAVASYAGFPPSARVPAGGRPLWAAEHDEGGGTVFTGGRDGHLWSLDTRTLEVRHADAHTDGIPSLSRDGDLLVSCSDDKTVALWRLPGPALRARTKAHDFLVNDLAVVEGRDGRELVTASSDGTVQRRTWPGLEPLEAIDASKLVARPMSLHAVWPAPGTRRILAGTWKSSLLDLVAEGGSWTAREHPVRSRSVYRLASVPRLGLVVAVGIEPSTLHVFDLASGTLRALDAAGLDAMWVVPVPGRDEVVVVGLDGVARYAFTSGLPDANGRRTLGARAWLGRQTGAGLQTATRLPDGSLWAGTTKGELVRFDLGRLVGTPLLERSLLLGPGLEPGGPAPVRLTSAP